MSDSERERLTSWKAISEGSFVTLPRAVESSERVLRAWEPLGVRLDAIISRTGRVASLVDEEVVGWD